MALPAGRYGVTKNQLLKIKKLPMNTIKLIEDLYEKYSLLGSAAFKNSTSVVTESSDLVESGAVKDIVGWGNKNLLNITLAKLKVNNSAYTWSGDVLSHNGASISFIESDGFVTGVSISGTVTSAFNVRLTDTGNLGYQGKILNGTVDSNKEYVYAFDEALSMAVDDTGNGITIPDTFTRYRIVLNVKAGTHDNEVIYPMISVNGGTYEPYHASVSDSLAEKCDNSTIAPTENGTTTSQAYAVGSHAIRNGAFITWKNAKSQGETINDASDYTSGDVAEKLYDIEKNDIIANGSTWPANSVNFSLVQDNTVMYRFSAMSHVGNLVDMFIVNRADGVIYANEGTDTGQCTYNDGVLTITLPNLHYWLYNMQRITTHR